MTGPAMDDDYARSIAVSPDGMKVVVTGRSHGGVGARDDYATVAYDAPTGSPVWARRFDGRGHDDDSGEDVAITADGRTLVTGYADMGRTGVDYVTMGLSTSTGAVVWLKAFSGTPTSSDHAQALAVSPDGAMAFVTGFSTGATGDDYATIAIDAATGGSLWLRRFDGPSGGFDEASGIAVSPDGSKVVVTGASDGGQSAWDYATIAYDAGSGNPAWLRRYDGPGHGNEFPFGIAMTPGGEFVYVTGYTETSTGFDYATISYVTGTGAFLGSRLYNGPTNGSDYGLTVATSSTMVFVAGRSEGNSSSVDCLTAAYAI